MENLSAASASKFRILAITGLILDIALFAVVFWIPLNQVSAQRDSKPPTFVGTVVDSTESVGIPRSHIWIHEDSGSATFVLQPDKVGNFSIHLPDGYYDVLFSAAGFAPFCKKIWIENGKTVKLNVRLGPDKDNLQD